MESECPEPKEKQDSKSGCVPSLFQTTRSILLEPTFSFKNFPYEESPMPAVIYMCLMAMVSVVVISVLTLVFLFLSVPSGSSMRSLGSLVGASLVFVLLMPVIVCVVAGFSAAALHVILGKFEARKAPFEQTLKAVCYIDGAHAAFALLFVLPMILSVITGLSGASRHAMHDVNSLIPTVIFLSLIASRVNCLTKGLAEIHACDRKSAFFAVITFLLLFVLYPYFLSSGFRGMSMFWLLRPGAF